MLEGLPPNNAAHVVRFTGDAATAQAIASIIVETFDPAEAAGSVFEREPQTDGWASRDWIAEVFFGAAPDEEGVRELVAATIGEDAARALVFARVEAKDWIASSLEGLAPVRVGRFLIHGSHDRGKVRSNDIGLEIEAALAFGTGHHGTTRGCLVLLDAILKRRRPHAVLDVGSGTGVLALAAAKSLKMKIAAGDIDPVAVAASRANAVLNHAGPYLFPVVAKGVAHARLQADGPYDLIFANILAKPLRLLAPSLAKAASSDADLVLSGLLGCDVAGVLSAYAAQGFRLARRIDIEGWASLLMGRAGAASRAPFAVE